jgi:hypothetical protein
MKQLSPLIKLFPRLILVGLCFGAIAQAVLLKTDQVKVMVKEHP